MSVHPLVHFVLDAESFSARRQAPTPCPLFRANIRTTASALRHLVFCVLEPGEKVTDGVTYFRQRKWYTPPATKSFGFLAWRRRFGAVFPRNFSLRPPATAATGHASEVSHCLRASVCTTRWAASESKACERFVGAPSDCAALAFGGFWSSRGSVEVGPSQGYKPATGRGPRRQEGTEGTEGRRKTRGGKGGDPPVAESHVDPTSSDG
ncbi:hypothetical protein B0H14DRAFT_2658508 [Mycena olivaceomarginata]|nr:hypothetical protein B0H14DRAFT_2658508 [Mycena olivaceomarginata]